VKIEPEYFAVIAQATMQTDPEAAMGAFGAALQAGTPEHKEVWVSALNWFPWAAALPTSGPAPSLFRRLLRMGDFG
jgi:hypothetical protein